MSARHSWMKWIYDYSPWGQFLSDPPLLLYQWMSLQSWPIHACWLLIDDISTSHDVLIIYQTYSSLLLVTLPSKLTNFLFVVNVVVFQPTQVTGGCPLKADTFSSVMATLPPLIILASRENLGPKLKPNSI